MSTIEDRINEYIDSMIPYCHEEGSPETPLYHSIGIKDMMRYMIKEEQKITRHACAESIMNSDEIFFSSCDGIVEPDNVILLTDAHNIIMNTQIP